MDSPSTSATALKLEIARLSGAINRHKSVESPQYPTTYRPRSNIYVNPNYRPQNRTAAAPVRPAQPPAPLTTNTNATRDVVLGGVAFESSGRSLVRKDLPKPLTKPGSNVAPPRYQQSSKAEFARTQTGHLIKTNRTYKAKPPRGHHGRNMTLDNNRRPYQSRAAQRRIKYSDKPCPRFTTTGACSRGLTCMYQHDPSKIAICWNFLLGTCPLTTETCNLSHDPTPERTPPCMHFANNGRCTRVNCPYPHVRLGSRHGVCRDFAVLGYCNNGLDCDKQHVRECPDFAENGACTTKGCKLPHVIRANRNRQPGANPPPPGKSGKSVQNEEDTSSSHVDSDAISGTDQKLPLATAEDAQLGDEFISLTFNESESSDADEDDDSEEDEEDEVESPTHQGDAI